MLIVAVASSTSLPSGSWSSGILPEKPILPKLFVLMAVSTESGTPLTL